VHNPTAEAYTTTAAATTRHQLSEQLQALAAQERGSGSSSGGDVADLAQLVLLGVAFYSSALPKAAKDLVERGMKDGE
jgi:hypothetical protein